MINVTRKAYEVLHRPSGWPELPPNGVNPNLRVMFVAARGGGERLRSKWPAEALALSGWRTGVAMGWPLGMSEPSVIIIHRPLAEDIFFFVKAYQEAGHVVLVSEDDDLNCIPKMNRWQISDEQREIHDQSIREADGLIVTTPSLLKVYGPLAKRVWTCPNYLPKWVSSPEFLSTINRPDDGKIRVGWAGMVDTHRQDLLWIKPHIRAMLRGAHVVLTTVGDPEAIQVLHTRGITHGPQKDIAKYYQFMGEADVGIVPLDNEEDKDFNTSKSWLKTLEYVSLGVPVVSTAMPEHVKLLDKTGAGLYVDTAREMLDAVQTIIHDGPLRHRMAHAALVLGRKMALENHISCWSDVLKEVADGAVR